jgi:RNA polymerase sigma factor (sigma-70 family)
MESVTTFLGVVIDFHFLTPNNDRMFYGREGFMSNRYDGFDAKLIYIVRLYAKKLFQTKILPAMDMDDIEQELLVHAINSFKNYNANLGSVHTFLETVIKNRASRLLSMNSGSKRGGRIVFEEFMEDRHVKRGETIDSDRIINIASLDKTLFFLSPVQRTLCELLRSHSMQEISEILQVNRATLHARFKVILKRIKRSQNWTRPNNFFSNGGYMKNLSVLETLTAKEISSLEVHDLMDLSDQVAKLTSHAKELKEKLEDGLNLKFSEAVKNNLRSENKDTGTTRFFDGAFQVVAEVSKKVTWDQEKMEELIKRVPDERIKSIVKITYAIEERKYAELPREYQELFREARTITPGKTRYQINIGENL